MPQALHILALSSGPFIPAYETLYRGRTNYPRVFVLSHGCLQVLVQYVLRPVNLQPALRCVRVSEVWVLPRTVLMTSLALS